MNKYAFVLPKGKNERPDPAEPQNSRIERPKEKQASSLHENQNANRYANTNHMRARVGLCRAGSVLFISER